MRDYNYKEKWKKLLTPEIVKKLTLIHEYKGEQRLFIEAHKDELNELVEIAKVQSTEASNRIEGISTANDRLKIGAVTHIHRQGQESFMISCPFIIFRVFSNIL